MESSEMPWRSMFDVAPVALSIVDTNGRIVAWNEACADLLGYPHDALGSLDVGRITRPEDQGWTSRYLLRLLGGEIDRFETDKMFVRKDGSEVLARLVCRAVVDEAGHCTHLVSATLPITDQPDDESATVAERLLQFGVENVTLIDADGLIRLTKGRRHEVQGYPTTFWRDRRVADILAPGEWERLEDVRAAMAAGPGATADVDVEIVTADGEIRTIATHVINCLDDPVLHGVVAVTRDVTDERAVLAELARRGRTAEEVVDARNRLLATVSHELRNPLHAVQGIAELLAGEPLPDRAAELARSLVRQITGLTRVTEDLLDAARLDAGTVTIEPVPTELAAVVGDVVDLGRAEVGDKPVAVTSRVAPGVPDWVHADPVRLRQVLTNLVGNAVKFTHRGSVQLVVRPDGPGSITFSVIDSGVGIPLTEQATILEPFAIGSTAGPERGAGLGLSIVHRLVEAMGGRMTFTSTVGEGTRFDVTLPLTACAPALPARAPAPLAGVRVLVVEDNPVNQELARRQLDRLGMDATIVGSGEDGFARLTAPGRDGFDVVLMDLRLPGWSGIETTERIRSLEGPLGRLPIVGVSASSGADDRDRCREAGMDDLVTKPATLDDLAGAIGRVLGTDVSGPATASGLASAGTTDADADVQDAADLDGGVLDQLAAELGDDAVVERLVATFLDELDSRVEATVDPDDTVVRRAAHTLQSSARLLGATRLADRCRAVEHGVAEGVEIVELAARARALLADWLYDRAR